MKPDGANILSSVVQIIHLLCVSLVFVFHKLDLFLNFSSLKLFDSYFISYFDYLL